MALKDFFGQDWEKLKEFFTETKDESSKNLKEFNENFKPIFFINQNKFMIIGSLTIVIILFIFPLITVWLLACLGTLYPSYKIFKMYSDDRRISQKLEENNRIITEYLEAAVLEQSIITLPIRKNGRLTERKVHVTGERMTGVMVKDPETNIDMTYPWDLIDKELLLSKYILPAKAS